ncbi:RNA polymerase sigma factor [Patescibacteria group bacterium]|nr:RNA polymerase sigma factor [Patescibacteria group bacterium]
MNQLSDNELIKACRSGDENALGTLIQRHLSAVYRFIFRMIGDRPVAEDLTQETFLKIWKSIRRFDPTKSFRAWTFAIAKNVVIDYLRKKKHLTFSEIENDEGQDIADTIPDIQPLPPEILERAELAQDIERALLELSPETRSIILMHEMEDFTFQEIAGVLKKPMNTVKSRYRRALLVLRGYLENLAPKKQ